MLPKLCHRTSVTSFGFSPFFLPPENMEELIRAQENEVPNARGSNVGCTALLVAVVRSRACTVIYSLGALVGTQAQLLQRTNWSPMATVGPRGALAGNPQRLGPRLNVGGGRLVQFKPYKTVVTVEVF